MKNLEINKEDLKSNIQIIKEINNKTVDDNGNPPAIIAVVKGNGMGLGLVEFTQFLIENGIDYFAVATIEEALELRNAKIENKILMLSSTSITEEIEKLVENDIILTIGSKESAEKINEIAEKLNKKVNVHLKIDTGFGRYGFIYTKPYEIIKTLKNLEYIQIEGTFTHFSKSYDEKWTNIQFNRFLDVVAELKKNEINPGILHVCNSTAFLNYENMHLNAVRLGSVFQGRVLSKEKFGLKKIGTFKSNVVEIKDLPAGFNISYSNMYKTKKETKIAVIPVGNMDGYNVIRAQDSFSFKDKIISILVECKNLFRDKRLYVYINNKKYYVLGKVGMYHITVDITNSDVKIGDEVTLEIPPILTSAKVRREYI